MNRAPLKAQSGPYGVVTAPPGLGVDRTASKVTLLVDVSVSGFRRRHQRGAQHTSHRAITVLCVGEVAQEVL